MNLHFSLDFLLSITLQNWKIVLVFGCSGNIQSNRQIKVLVKKIETAYEYLPQMLAFILSCLTCMPHCFDTILLKSRLDWTRTNRQLTLCIFIEALYCCFNIKAKTYCCDKILILCFHYKGGENKSTSCVSHCKYHLNVMQTYVDSKWSLMWQSHR